MCRPWSHARKRVPDGWTPKECQAFLIAAAAPCQCARTAIEASSYQSGNFVESRGILHHPKAQDWPRKDSNLQDAPLFGVLRSLDRSSDDLRQTASVFFERKTPSIFARERDLYLDRRETEQPDKTLQSAPIESLDPSAGAYEDVGVSPFTRELVS